MRMTTGVLLGVLAWARVSGAQDGAPAAEKPAGPPPTAQASAPIDLTGYWVSVISEDWRWRMVTPAKGDYASVPLTLASKTVADTWNPAKDTAAGEACRGYGAPGIMRLPGRLHITWADAQTLQVDIDTGQQTRRLAFAGGAAAKGAGTWQGVSAAVWERPTRSSALATAAGPGDPARMRGGNLKVVTTRLKPGYLRKNGLPYSAQAVLTEYWDLSHEPNGDWWLVVTSVVHDPLYLQTDWITSLNFKKEADGSKWDPTPCVAK